MGASGLQGIPRGQEKLAIQLIMTTRIAGGLLLGYNPMVPGQGLKPLA